MSTLRSDEKKVFERLFNMGSGYVLSFSDREFGDFFADHEVEIHSSKYTANGTSKAKKLRSFWDLENDGLVARVLRRLVLVSKEEAKTPLSDDARPSVEDLERAENAINRLEETQGSGRTSDKPFFLATLTVTISDISFSDFIKQSGNSNSLSKFQHELAALQTKLEALPEKHLNLPMKFKRGSGSSLEKNPRTITLSNFSVINVTYSDGSVVAKIQIGCAAALGITTFLATYPDAKDGYQELRNDLQALSSQIFVANDDGAPPPEDQESNNVGYYFLKPETAEENMKKLSRRSVLDSDPNQEFE